MKKILALILCMVILSVPVNAYAANEKETGISLDFNIGWNVKSSEIHPEIRTVGNLCRIFLPYIGVGFFRMAGFFLDTIGLPDFTKNIKREVKYIDRDGSGKLRINVYYPEKKKSNVPGLLWIHGGGYGMGCPEQDFSFIQSFVDATGCVVVAPDYVNSTKSPYPAAFNDCYKALLWLKENGSKYGMRKEQIFIGGNSAGGGLCAAVTLKARDTGDVNIAFQMPLYPMMDDRMITASMKGNDAPVWNEISNRNAWRLYLGDSYGTSAVSKYAAAARETDYRNLPPTLTYIGTVDPFYDETRQYVQNLRSAGVEVKFKTFEGCYHAFDYLFYTSPAKQAREFLVEGFVYAAENYTAKNN